MHVTIRYHTSGLNSASRLPELLEYGEIGEDEAHDFLHDFYGGAGV